MSESESMNLFTPNTSAIFCCSSSDLILANSLFISCLHVQSLFSFAFKPCHYLVFRSVENSRRLLKLSWWYRRSLLRWIYSCLPRLDIVYPAANLKCLPATQYYHFLNPFLEKLRVYYKFHIYVLQEKAHYILGRSISISNSSVVNSELLSILALIVPLLGKNNISESYFSNFCGRSLQQHS